MVAVVQEYYANTGALVAAAESARKAAGKEAGQVGCSVVEAFGGEPRPVELEGVLRMEYRSKLLNPKWAKAMAAQVRPPTPLRPVALIPCPTSSSCAAHTSTASERAVSACFCCC